MVVEWIIDVVVCAVGYRCGVVCGLGARVTAMIFERTAQQTATSLVSS